MRQRLSFVLGAFGAALILLAFTQGKISKTPLNAKKAAIGCSPDWESQPSQRFRRFSIE